MKYQKETIFCMTDTGETVSIFKPDLFHLLPANCGNLNTEQGVKLRFLYRFLIGYRIYILRKNDEFLSYVMFQRGKIARYPFVKRNMLLMGPYFTAEQHRGKGYAGQLVSAAFERLSNYKTVFAWIASDNEASCKAVSKMGFSHVGYLCCDRLRKELTQTPTNHLLWAKELKE